METPIYAAIDPNFRLLGHPRPQGGLRALYSGAGVRVSTGQRFGGGFLDFLNKLRNTRPTPIKHWRFTTEKLT